MGDFEYKIVKRYGVIADHNGVTLELNLIKWGNNPEKLDLRAWSKGYAKGGITLTKDELYKLGDLIDLQQLKIKEPQIKELVKSINWEDDSAKSNKDISKLDTKETKATPVKDNIIQLPKPRPEIVKLITNGNATYEQCVEKIEKDKAIYIDPDSQYVLDGLLELCKVDADFRNNVMREDKNFAGVMNYMADMCKGGYGYKYGNGYTVDRDLGLGFAIDYFNSEPKPKTTLSNITSTSSEPKKRGRKKKGA